MREAWIRTLLIENRKRSRGFGRKYCHDEILGLAPMVADAGYGPARTACFRDVLGVVA